MKPAIVIALSTVLAAILLSFVASHEASQFRAAEACENLRRSIGPLNAAVYLEQSKDELMYQIGKSKYSLKQDFDSDRHEQTLDEISRLIAGEEGLNVPPAPKLIERKPATRPAELKLYEDLYGITLVNCVGL